MRIVFKVPTFLSIIAMQLMCLSPTVKATIDNKFQISLGNFSRNIFNELLTSNGPKSLIISPFSIQTCLSMVRMGAEGETAEQLDRGLSLTNQNIQTVAENYHSLLSKYENSQIINIANKVYVMINCDLNDEYEVGISKKFFSAAENLDFSQPESAASVINTWAASQTDNAITNLVSADNLDANTRLLLLNAIHFKGKWTTEFPKESTAEDDFYIDDKQAVKVQMMKVKSTFRIGDNNELQASAILLPYKDCDLSMLILLPYATDGLAGMERKLKNIDLSALVKRDITMSIKTEVRLPKFKAEFKIKLNDVLKKMGMEKMFSNGDFGKMLKSPQPLVISEVIHQASIEVNEEGTKAAAITAANPYLRSAFPFYSFDADHPFYYAIINEDGVPLFEGTFVGV